MPNLIYPSPYPMVTAETTSGSDVLALIDNAATPEDSWSIINGKLDYLNVDDDYLLPAELTQRGSIADGGSVSGTANLDYCWRWFGDYDSPADTSFAFADSDPYQAIPGGAVSFHMPWNGWVLVTWVMFAQNDNFSSTAADYANMSEFVLIVNGDYENAQRRSINRAGPSGNPEGYKKARVWSGHAVFALGEGHHDVALHVVADKEIRMTRVHAVSMQYLRFKGAT